MGLRAALFLAIWLCGIALAPMARAAEGTENNSGWTHAKLVWEQVPALPDPIGFAGPYAGVSNGALIVAGGANFPDGPPWEGHQKVWHDRIFILERPDGQWKTAEEKLHAPLAYGVSVTTERGVLCIGGGGAAKHIADVFLLQWANGKIVQTEMPPLPTPLAYAAGAVVGNVVYVAGGSIAPDAMEATKTFLALDLAESTPQWKILEPWPGEARILPVAGAQEGSFFLFSGAKLLKGNDGKVTREYLRDAYRYTPGTGWKRVKDLPRPAAAAATPAPAVGQSHLLIVGGDDGTYFFTPGDKHGGFAKDVPAYHTITDTWVNAGQMNDPRAVTAAVPWHDRFVIPSGEIRAGVRSPGVLALSIERVKPTFGWLNYAMLILYPLVMLTIAWLVGKKQTSDEFFRGGQRIPWWAAALSIYATMLSSITYMAIPAKAYVTNWSYFITVAAIVAVAPVVAFIYLPFFRQLDVTSAYEYLEKRFNLATRWLGSISFLILQLGRTAIVLYLPALAMATVTQFDIVTCILVMGGISILMTFLGGVEAVVWTDVAQTVILLAGALLSLVFIVLKSDLTVGAVVAQATGDQKVFETLSWQWDWTAATVPVMFFGYFMWNLIPYTASQDVVQRYMTTKNQKQAAKAILSNALIVIPSSILFFAVGTALYVFYKSHPSRLDPQIANDQIFPLFMVSELPAGVAGLVVAGIFAAAQPTSNLNSMATALVTDFYKRLRPETPDKQTLRLAQTLTVFLGILGTGAALVLATLPVASLWDVFLQLIGLSGAALAGLFALGIFTNRAHGTGALIGAVAGMGVLTALWFNQRLLPVHFFLHGAIGIGTCFIVGYLASLILPGQRKPLEGLTLYTKRKPLHAPAVMATAG